jgi:DNA mismatch endonuclease, patch repair protein
MADVLTVEHRSRVMAAVKGSGNKNTELRLIGIMRLGGIKGWRRNCSLPGKPDFVFAAARVAIFVDGCFWHGCPIHCRKPSSNREYWLAKIERNRKRDRKVRELLRENNWVVVRIWEHSLKHPQQVISRLQRHLAR